MRIACVHVPQFALQCLARIDPGLAVSGSGAGVPVAVVGAGTAEPAPGARRSLALNSPIVLAYTRAAWALGARLGMTAAAARSLSPDLKVVAADPALERETARAIADALLGVSAVVDAGGRVGAGGAHLAMYCEVPAKMRGASFGDRLVGALDALGLTGRIGIADDRFTAWVAAAYGGTEDREVLSVPRGGSAAFLAPRPLSLLAITPEVQHMLEALGVRTLGEFAALPAPSVARPLEADYRALARGEGGLSLRPYAPEAPIREERVISAFVGDAGGSLFGGPEAVAIVAQRIALRLAGRARGAARLEVSVDGEVRASLNPMANGRVLAGAVELIEALGPVIGELPAGVKVGVAVAGEAVVADALSAPSAAREVAEVPNVSHVVSIASIGAARDAAAGGAPAGVPVPARAPVAAAVDGVVADAPAAVIVDALSFALSQLVGRGDYPAPELAAQPSWATILRGERRDAHRRTKRGKQRRRATVADAVQPRLFGTDVR